MIRIGDRNLLHAWQTIRAATQPSLEATAWEVAGVRWHRHRHSYAAPDLAVVIDAHRLDQPGGSASWNLLVVTETWWDEGRRVVRSQVWATQLTGPKQPALDWINKQAEVVEHTAQQLRTDHRP